MRPYLAIAIVLILVVLFAGKMFLFPKPAAQARSPAATTASMDVFQMHLDHPAIRQLPDQTVKEPF
jgi:hypothetical protein